MKNISEKFKFNVIKSNFETSRMAIIYILIKYSLGFFFMKFVSYKEPIL